MTVYLWDAPGPRGFWCGVSGTLGQAREAAEACLTPGRAMSAQVEAALLATSVRTLQPLYERTGIAWQARPVDGGVRWDPAMPADAPPAQVPRKEP